MYRKWLCFFSAPDGHPADHRNIICFDRFTGDVLWLIEESHGRWLPENNRNMYVSESWEHTIHYETIKVLCRDAAGHPWIEEDYNWVGDPRGYREHWVDPVADVRVARHPDYREPRKRYRIVPGKAYWVRSGTHEMVLRDWEEEDDRTAEERGYCGLVKYTDATSCTEEDCLLVAFSYEFYFEVDLHTGKVTPAYAVIEETK